MIKNIILIISLVVNVLLYTGAINIGQYRNYVDNSIETLKNTNISIDTPAGAASGSVNNIKFSGK